MPNVSVEIVKYEQYTEVRLSHHSLVGGETFISIRSFDPHMNGGGVTVPLHVDDGAVSLYLAPPGVVEPRSLKNGQVIEVRESSFTIVSVIIFDAGEPRVLWGCEAQQNGTSVQFDEISPTVASLACSDGLESVRTHRTSREPLPPPEVQDPEVDATRLLSDLLDSSSLFKSVSVSGYRGFSEKGTISLAQPNEKPGSGLTIVVGANNSGKSAFLEAIRYLALARTVPELSFPETRRNRLNSSVELILEMNNGDQLQVKSVRPESSLASGGWENLETPRPAVDIQVTAARRMFNPYTGIRMSSDRDWDLMNQDFSRTRVRDEFVSRLIAVDRDEDKRDRFNRLLHRVTGEPLNWTVEQHADNTWFIKLEGVAGWHTSEGLGEGLVSLLFIVDALYDSKPGSLVVIDEPEQSLHPQLVRRLREVLSDYSRDRQILVSTHSPLLIDWSDVRNGATITRVFKDANTRSSAIAQPTSETLQELTRLSDLDNRFNPHALGSEAREAFFLEDGILLTEGQDDVVHLPLVLEDLGLDPIENVFGWGSDGADNIPKLVDLFKELGFKRIAVLVDSNKQDVADRVLRVHPDVVANAIPAPDIRYKNPNGNKPEVIGLLDKKSHRVRPEFREKTKEILSDIAAHVAPRY